MQDKINSIKLKNGFFIWSTVNKSQNKGSNPTRMKEYIHTHTYMHQCMYNSLLITQLIPK